MSDLKDENNGGSGRKTGTLGLSSGKPTRSVRRNVSGGRSGPVVVETKKKKRVLNPNAPQPAPVAPKKTVPAPAKPTVEVKKEKPVSKPQTTLGGLSGSEQERRLQALEQEKSRTLAREAEEEALRQRRKEEDEKRRKAKEIEARKSAGEAAAAQDANRDGLSGDDREKKRNKIKPRQAAAATASAQAAVLGTGGEVPGKKTLRPVERRERKDDRSKTSKADRTRQNSGRMRGRLTVNNALNENQRERSLASLKRKREKEKSKAAGITQPTEKFVRDVVVPEVITIQELANRMAERAVDVIKYLMKEGQMHQINDVIEGDVAELIVAEFGHNIKRVSESDVEQGFIGQEDADEDLKPRAPVVTVMGHVDHGKTSLLDALRKAKVVAGEAGGITQHIGAYQVEGENGKVTFIDTPGHAAFTAMRARGAQVTDIVILVVAADDSVMPQTVEAINHAKEAGVPLILAINKIDLPAADPQKVRTELLQHEVIVESLSGETLEIEVSAKTGAGLDDLIEAVHNQAEIMDLKANPKRSGEGVVVEAKLERGRGPVGTMLVQRGAISVGNIIVAGKAWGKVRALINDRGENVATAGPSEPVEVLGFNSAPEAGDQFAVVENEARAREITDYRIRKRREVRAAGAGSVRSLETMMSQLAQDGIKEFPLLIKGDVQGSVEAINAALDKLGNEEVTARVIHSGVGGITESDITLANASNAAIIGFNVRANVQAKQAAQDHGLEIRYYSIIYDLVDDVKAAMSGMLDPERKEHFLGNAEILDVFHISKIGKVAGCRVTEGKIERGAGVRLIRDNVVIHEGKLITLKRFKDEVKEVPAGQECGMAFEGYQDLKKGDIMEAFNVETIERTL